MAKRGLAGLDAVDREFHDIRLFGFEAEGRDDGVQRPHPVAARRACAERSPQRIDFGHGKVRMMTGSMSASTSSVARPGFSISAM